MLTRTSLFVPTLFLLACATETESPTLPLPPNGGVPEVIHVPEGVTPFSTSAFVFTGATAPGSANVVDATLDSSNQAPTMHGTGAMNITVNGQLYSSTALESTGMVFDDGAEEYLVFGGYELHTVSGVERATQVFVVVLRSDFAVGATVDLDGAQRFAMFGEGPTTNEEPELVAAAITGTVTFTGGSIAANGTGSITANMAGDFGEISYVPANPPSGSTLAAGSYMLHVDAPTATYCDGTLAGQESAFAGITAASLGLVDGAVTVATSPSASISGPVITSAFGAVSLALDDMGDGLVAGLSDENVAGPAGTTRAGKFLVFDAGSASATFVNGATGAAYVTHTGTCSVSFGASLTP